MFLEMKISRSFLQGFVGGELYLRFPDFEVGRQCWFLFRSLITEVEKTTSGFGIIHQPIFPNRFIDTEGWVDHLLKYDENINSVQFVFEGKPNFKMVDDRACFFKLDNVAEGLMFLPGFNHGADPYKFYPPGYEVYYFDSVL
jgi:hypothetical protein